MWSKESVQDYPRPPRIEGAEGQLQVVFGGVTIAETDRGVRVLEKGHAPTYYFPPQDVEADYLEPTPRRTVCEWKGRASYYSVRVGDREAENAAWCYPDPTPEFEEIRDYVAFYPRKMDRCLVDGVEAEPQPGDYYGGWVTPDVEGPFRG